MTISLSLSSDPVNQASLDLIETAQFVLCMDTAHPLTSSLPHDAPFSNDHSSIVLSRVLHGNGSQYNGANRWYDHAAEVSSADSILCGF